MIRLTWDTAFRFIPIVLFTWVISSAHTTQLPEPQAYTTTAPLPLELLQQCQQADGATISRLVKQLQQFPLEAFNEDSRLLVESLITNNSMHTAKFIKLAGFLGRCNFIQGIRADYEQGSPEKLATNLALVRCGDPAKTASFIRNLRKAKFGDDFIYEVVPMMIYTRNEQVFALLEEYTNRSEKLCTTEGETGVPANCGYRIIEQLAPVLRNYPFKLQASGDLQTKDYPAALSKVREWMKSFNGRLPIITNTY